MNRTLPFVIFISILFAFLTGCGVSYPLQNDVTVPGATGEVKLKIDDNSNTLIKLKVKHLAQPEKLSPSKSVYVVWSESSDGKAMNLGQLVVDDDLEGELNATTPMRYFRIIVTAENEPTVTIPGMEIVLSTERMNPGK